MATAPAAERPRVVIDANLFFVPPVRDFLLTAGWLAEARLLDVAWSDALLAEVERNWARVTGPERAEERWHRFEGRFRSEFAAGRVATLAPLPAGGRITPEDRHIVALAVAAGATGIITLNLRHFPAGALAPLGLRAWHPDAFCQTLYATAPQAVEAILAYQGSILRPPRPFDVTLRALAGCCPGFAARVRDRRGST
jgi:hypothetical protein